MFPFKDDVPTETTPFVTWIIIAINIAVFIYQITLPREAQEALVYAYGSIPAHLTDPDNWTAPFGSDNALLSVLTSMFLHGGIMHLFGNMLYLWIFGNNVEDAMGHFRFVVFYLLSGLAASLLQTAGGPESQIPMIGASGAIAGVLGAYLLLHPFARVYTLLFFFIFIRIVQLPAILVLSIWFLLQIFSSLAAPAAEGGVAYLAHVGGFVAGLALIRFFQKRHRSLKAYWR